MRTLKIPYFNENESFDGAAVAAIDQYTWGGDYCPVAFAKIFHTDDAFYICMQAEEKAENLRIVEYGITEDACEDSCLEFFIMPYPEKDKRYFNFEFTLSGAIYLGVGHDRYDNVLLTETDLSQFNICTYMTNENGLAKWKVTAKIPYKFLREAMGMDIPFSDGQEMYANFYKCGGKCKQRHHGTWNLVDTPDADFHLPEFFGKMIIVGQKENKKAPYETKVNLKKYEEKIKSFEARPLETDKIICYGSSTFTRWTNTGAHNNINIEEAILDKNGNKIMLNHGFGGCTAEELLYYYPRAVKAYSPKGLIICIFWNDGTFGYSAEEVMTYIKKIFDYARADFPGIKLGLCNARPLLSGMHRSKSYYDHVYGFNKMCKEYCEQNPDCILIDNTKAEMFFAGELGDYSNIRPEYYIEDRVHLTPEGYELYTEFFKNQIKDML